MIGRSLSLGPLAIAVFAFGVAAISASQSSGEWTILIGGDTDGYLSPCGCTKPMSGGIRRRATAFRALSPQGRTLVLDNGSLVAGTSRQDEMKAETMVQALDALGTTAINLAPADVRLGRGVVLSLADLSGRRFVNSNLQPSETAPAQPYVEKGPFLVGAVSTQADLLAQGLGEQVRPTDEAVASLVMTASQDSKVPILLFSGNREAATDVAKAHPELALIVYRSLGSPEQKPITVGSTLLVTPGERGKNIVQLTCVDGRISGYAATNLGPEYSDDPKISRIYRTYLSRVGDEKLLDRVPRTPGPAYVGSAKCGSCHPSALKVWRDSGHHHALATLEKEGHALDPECVSCHVTGLDSKRGYKSRSLTPLMTDVTCESCHGPGAKHASTPVKVAMPKVLEPTCIKCHSVDNSPGFDYPSYWKRIKH